MDYGSPAPAAWLEIPPRQRKKRSRLSSDQCTIDDQYFFILGNIEIPVLDSSDVFQWSVWVSLSRENFDRASRLWNTPGREKEAPYFGWLSTLLPVYPDTLNLKTNVHTRPVGERPSIELEPTDHPLAVEQRLGMRLERVREIAGQLLHGKSGASHGRTRTRPDARRGLHD